MKGTHLKKRLLIEGAYPSTWHPASWTACETKPMRPMLPPPYTRFNLFLICFIKQRKTKKKNQDPFQRFQDSHYSIKITEPALELDQWQHLCNTLCFHCCFHRTHKPSWISTSLFPFSQPKQFLSCGFEENKFLYRKKNVWFKLTLSCFTLWCNLDNETRNYIDTVAQQSNKDSTVPRISNCIQVTSFLLFLFMV